MERLRTKPVSPRTKVQCLLIHGILLEHDNKPEEVLTLYQELWDMDISDKKLMGDIANRIARVELQLADKRGRWHHQRQACIWILRAEEMYKDSIRTDPAVVHALFAVQSRAALLFYERSQLLWQEAVHRFEVTDRSLWAIYYFNRFKVSLAALQFLRAGWYVLCFSWMYLRSKKS